MLEDIKDLIAKNLPQQVGEELQKQLAKIPELERQLEITKADNEKLLDQKTQLQNKFDASVNLDHREAELIAAQDIFNEEKRLLENELLKKDLECANTIIESTNSHTAMLLRNTDYRRHYHKTLSSPNIEQHVDSNGYSRAVQVGTSEITIPETETSTAE